jgi:hypothetical protein
MRKEIKMKSNINKVMIQSNKSESSILSESPLINSNKKKNQKSLSIKKNDS